MNEAQTWDPERYAKNARFVSDLAAPVLELLSPKAGERILDLGCGDGVLTEKLAAKGCLMLGVDSSAELIRAAEERGIDARVLSGEELDYAEEFDAVFSNAALHWMRRADDVVLGVYRALRPGGRFVAECGGVGCVHRIRTALVQALNDRQIDGEAHVPWYFPTPGEYALRLERAGFQVDSIALIPRPTPLPGNVLGWLETFGESFSNALPASERPAYLQQVQNALEPLLRNTEGVWFADYVRLRFMATKPAR
jgi:trans-aconitate methyltransferase